MEILENKAGEVTTGAYLLSITETVNSVQQSGTGALLIVENCISGLIWGTDSIYLFDSHSKDVNGDIALFGKLYEISLLQCLPDDHVLSTAISKSSLHCHCQECHKMFIFC